MRGCCVDSSMHIDTIQGHYHQIKIKQSRKVVTAAACFKSSICRDIPNCTCMRNYIFRNNSCVHSYASVVRCHNVQFQTGIVLASFVLVATYAVSLKFRVVCPAYETYAFYLVCRFLLRMLPCRCLTSYSLFGVCVSAVSSLFGVFPFFLSAHDPMRAVDYHGKRAGLSMLRPRSRPRSLGRLNCLAALTTCLTLFDETGRYIASYPASYIVCRKLCLKLRLLTTVSTVCSFIWN